MSIIHRGATLTPHFRDFLPGWLAEQPWYRGGGTPSLTPVGYFRFEDPAGAVGMETHLVSDGDAVYQLPLTYRDAPLEAATGGLVTTAEHSVLGTRWIYDATEDPVWVAAVLRLVRDETVSEDSQKTGAAPARARGHRLTRQETDSGAVVELVRIVAARPRPEGGDLAGVVMGTWCPDGPGTPPVDGCLAVVRDQWPR